MDIIGNVLYDFENDIAYIYLDGRWHVKPALNRLVHYRGNQGYQTMRAAIVTCTTEELDPRGVEAGTIEPLDSDMHVHLLVFTPSRAGSFPEFNVPFGVPGEDGKIPPGTWCWPKKI